MQPIITRFPPSPSGYLHVGNARTAIFNWLYARHMKGHFVLRIEDTDKERSTKESVEAIFEALEWLGVDWDEGPYFQSERSEIYQQHIQQLLDTDRAYYCTCTPEALEAMRKKGMAAGGKPKYDGTCREKGLTRTENAVARFKAPLGGTTVLEDVVKGNIVFQNTELDDFIIARSDGSPTYNFAVVVDDITMGINTIIRGDDHVMNTPKQMLLYNALECPLPIFAHVPMVLGPDRRRLSKRHGAMSVTAYRDMGFLPDAFINYLVRLGWSYGDHGAMSVTAYRDMGFLPDAFINYLVRLGWSYGDQEFFNRQELIEKFSLENIGRSAGIFDPEKLLALNADHIKATQPEALVKPLASFLKTFGHDIQPGPFIESVIKTLYIRSKTLKNMAEDALFYFAEDISYDEKAAKQFLKPTALEPIQLLIAELESLDQFDQAKLENTFKSVMEKTGLKLGKIAQPVRVALTGRTASPGIFEIIEIIGKEKVISRLKKAIRFIKDNG
jgi:glutamyl-tRNA synthetase